ncbi:MAG TPA: hypothetical protein VHM94_11110 [Acidimicrobiia bacterium]|nr:hypothetical protein [Acidimicrobiia bacterium]
MGTYSAQSDDVAWVGQVRDVLPSEGGDEIPLYATVAEAVATLRTPS